MATSTNLISGLSSGIDWQTMITHLIAVDHRRVDLISLKKDDTQNRLTEWQSFNTKLLALKTAAGNLKNRDDFTLFKAAMTTNTTVAASDLLSVTTAQSASQGSYTVKINNIATAQKLSSGSFASVSTELGAEYAGDILINGTTVSISSTDTLAKVVEKINNANAGTNPTGVTAGVVTYAAGDYRLILTSDTTGAEGISLANGGGTDILNRLGLTDTSRSVKNHLTGGDQTDRFTSTNVSIQSLLGLTAPQASAAGEIVINGHAVGAIDLATDTLSSLQTKLSAAGVTASITTETKDGQTTYRLMVEGSANTYTDKNNILETLGFIKAGVSDVYGVTGDTANTSGGAVITADTLLKDIDGYTGYLSTDYIHLEGTDTNGLAVSDDSFVLSDTTTVGDLLTKIESLFGDVTASITGAGKLSVIDNTTGASPLALKIDVRDNGGASDTTLRFDQDGNLGSAVSVRSRQLTAGMDASLVVDQTEVSRSTNTIDDLLTGITLDLLKADTSTTITLNVGRDLDAIVKNIQSFVTSYNSVASYIKTQSSYNATEEKAGGILFGDGTLASVKSDLTSVLVGNVWGVSSSFSSLGLVGISVDTQGQLSVDTTKLRGYLTTNFNDVTKLFVANGETSNGTLSYISHANETNAGEYTVNITTAATQSTSAASDNTSLTGDETLTITEGDKTALVNLTAGMTMSQIVTAINSELETVYTQKLAGSEQLYADAGHTTVLAASTTWDSIYDSTGNSAGLAAGDVISFSGTTRAGAVINGSYTIGATTGTVQDFLSEIETAFENTVTATIDENGRIVVTDKTSGTSKLTINIDTTLAHDLDFGTILADNTGGQEGRYAMAITALADAGGHLVLHHNSYGSGYSFTIHQANNLLWTGGDLTVNNGLDVAGTINGEAATGSGQVLTGASGAANVDGLVIKYTGTAAGDVGTVKLTLGVAELYDRVLFNITDSIDGYLAFKQQSLQDSIKRYDTQIAEMEARLELKREQLLARYASMEIALQKIQSQSNWLAGQLTAASSGWFSK